MEELDKFLINNEVVNKTLTKKCAVRKKTQTTENFHKQFIFTNNNDAFVKIFRCFVYFIPNLYTLT